MRELYPELAPFNTHQLQADERHTLYVEECGNPLGIPVIFLHGGPGSGCNENHRRYFNPDKYHIVIFDQRGCNRSIPQGEVCANTTWDLVADMERIRTHLDIEKWLLFGGSWGATLGLLYAQKQPNQVTGMILRGAFLARQQDVDWFFQRGVGRIFPEHWAEFIEVLPERERHDPISAYHARLHGSDTVAREAAARAWANWSGRVVTYLLPPAEVTEALDMAKVTNEVTIETHYAVNRYFIQENQILEEVGKLPDVPIHIIHGRRDLTCTLDASWSLHQALPRSKMVIVREGGHLAGEPVMIDALINATDEMAVMLS